MNQAIINAKEKDTNLDSLQYAVAQAFKRTEPKPETQEILVRTIKSMIRSLLMIGDDLPSIRGIRSAEGSEIIALVTQEVLKQDPLVSKEALLKLKGLLAFREQVIEAGGVYSTQQVATLLRTTTSAVRKRLERGRLLSVPFGENSSYPVWQFEESDVVKGFAETLSLLDTSSVGAFRFFQTYDEDLGCTPIEALKKGESSQLDQVKILAQQFNQHVAR